MTDYRPFHLTNTSYVVCNTCAALVGNGERFEHERWHEHIALPTDGPGELPEPTPPAFDIPWSVLALPDRDVAVEELSRVYEAASGNDYPSHSEVRKGVSAILDRVFKYLDLGK